MESGANFATEEVNSYRKTSTFLAILNTVIHMMIATILFNLWSFAISNTFTDNRVPLHILFAVTGYLLLMMEAIMTINTHNTWSNYLLREHKKIIHLTLNGIGGVCVLVAFILIVTYKKSGHFSTAHGICGLIGFIFTLLSSLNGTVVYLGHRLDKNIRPTPVKFVHSILGTTTITMGLVTLCIGINKDIFYDKNIATCLTVFIVFTLAYTIIQPLTNAKRYANNMRTTVL